MDSGRQQRVCGRVSAFPAPRATGSKIGILEDELREGLGTKRRVEARECSKEKCRFRLETGERDFP